MEPTLATPNNLARELGQSPRPLPHGGTGLGPTELRAQESANAHHLFRLLTAVYQLSWQA